jgi:hypothetical protein
LCFNAALRDPRVIGLIITNPYISFSQLSRTVPLHLLLTRVTWQKVKSGQFNVRKHASKLAARAARCVGQGHRSADSAKAAFAWLLISARIFLCSGVMSARMPPDHSLRTP